MHVLCNMKTMVVFNALTQMRAFPLTFFSSLFFSVIVIVSFQMFVYGNMYPHPHTQGERDILDRTRARAYHFHICVYRNRRYPNKM